MISLMLGFMMSGICSAAINPNQSIINLTTDLNYPKMAIIVSNIGVVKQYPRILDGINEKILTLSKSRFSLQANQKISTQFLEFLEDNNITDPNNLKRGEIADFGRKYGYRYVAVLYFNQVKESTTYDSFIINWGSNKMLSAEMVAKVVDVDNNSYIYRKDIIKEGRSSVFLPAITRNDPVTTHAWLDIVDLCTNEFIDALPTL